MNEQQGKPDVTAEGKLLIEEWFKATEEVKFCRQRLNSAQTAETNAAIHLSKWMLPEDAEVGEKISVWFVDNLIQVEVTSKQPLEGKLSIRTRGRSWPR